MSFSFGGAPAAAPEGQRGAVAAGGVSLFGQAAFDGGGAAAAVPAFSSSGAPVDSSGAPVFGGPLFGGGSSLQIPPDTTGDNFERIINNQEFADVRFEVGGEQIFGHKVILAARSTWFSNLLGGPMCESMHNNHEDSSPAIKMEDISSTTFLHVLHFLYTGDVKSTTTLAEYQELLIASDMYLLDRLKAVCAQSIGQQITFKTATSTLLLSHRHHADGLKRYTMDFITKNWSNEDITESIPILEQDATLMTDYMSYIRKNYSRPFPSSSDAGLFRFP